MRLSVLAKTVGCFILFSFLGLVPQRGDGASPAPLLQAKKEAETKGYSFFATHEEIVTMAKKEEKLGVSSNLEPQNFKPLIIEIQAKVSVHYRCSGRRRALGRRRVSEAYLGDEGGPS